MDRITAIFVDGIGTAAATSGVINQLQGRIFALLYLQQESMALEDVAAELQQSKSNISVNIRGLVDWHLVHRAHLTGSRKDHYQAATDLVRVMQEIMERRFRWNMRQVVATANETANAIDADDATAKSKRAAFMHERLEALRGFFAVMDSLAGMFGPGQPFPPGVANEAPRSRGEAAAHKPGRKSR
jgi:DNA-binding transcriptional regulator GbsR (MarR family)